MHFETKKPDPLMVSIKSCRYKFIFRGKGRDQRIIWTLQKDLIEIETMFFAESENFASLKVI